MTEALSYLAPVIDAVEKKRHAQPHVVLAIDGMSAAGKTTAAAALAELWSAPVIHMDDFFLPLPLRTPERLSEPGGNVHYERFAQEVLPGLAAGEPFSYRVFDCGRMDYTGTAEIPAAPVVIVEGAYALHPRFGDYADIRVFFSIDESEQERRVIRRGGKETWEAFRTRWIPMENAYHTAFHTRERAGIVLHAT